jgi:hypothetical protein
VDINLALEGAVSDDGAVVPNGEGWMQAQMQMQLPAPPPPPEVPRETPLTKTRFVWRIENFSVFADILQTRKIFSKCALHLALLFCDFHGKEHSKEVGYS